MTSRRPFFILIGLVFAAAMSPLCPGQGVPTTWRVNGNGYTGLLVLNSVNPTTHEVNATLLGTPARGFLVGRHLVLHRNPQGGTQIWDGWIMDPKLGAAGQPYYDGTLFIAGLISEDKGPVDGVYPWYAVTQVGASPEPVTNLIRNGDFEQGTPGNKKTTGITHWQVTRDNVDLVHGYWQQVNGSRSIDLAGSPGNGAIAQTFATIPGRQYEVTFVFAGNPYCDQPLKQMRVHAAGQFADFSCNTKGRSLAAMGWQKKSWTFTARAASTTLVFENIGPNRICGVALDNVSVVQR